MVATPNMIGHRIKRKEYRRFITGTGKYTDDIKHIGIPHMAHLRIARLDEASPQHGVRRLLLLLGLRLSHVHGSRSACSCRLFPLRRLSCGSTHAHDRRRDRERAARKLRRRRLARRQRGRRDAGRL